MANIDIESAGEFIPEIWGTLVQHPLRKNTVAMPLTDRRWEKFTSDNGDRTFIPSYSEITANEEARSTNAGFDSRGAADGEWSESALTFTDLTASQTVLEIDRRVYSAVIIDDPVKMQENISVLQIMTAEMGRAIAETVDSRIWATIGATSNNKGALNKAIDEVDILDSKEVLDVNKAVDTDRFLVVSPEGYMDLLNIDRYTNALYEASFKSLDSDMGRGWKGRIMDFDIYMTTNLPTSGTGTLNYFFQREAIAFAMQAGVQVTRREPHDQFASAVRAVTYFGVLLNRGAAAVEISGR